MLLRVGSRPQTTTFFLKLPGAASDTFSRDAFGFQIIFHPAGPVQHKKNSMLGVVVTLLGQHHARRAPKWFCVGVCCFDIFRKWAWSLLRVKEIKKSDSLLTHDFFVYRCCVGTNSGHNTGFQTIFHSAGLVATQNTLL